MSHSDELLTIEAAAEYLGVTKRWMYDLRRAPHAPLSWREGRRLVYPRSGLDLYRARQREVSIRGGKL